MPEENGVGLAELRFASDLIGRLHIAQRLGQTFEGERDLYATFGYRKTVEFDDYLSYYLRGGIAGKIVDLAPQASWRHAPIIRSENQEFVDAVDELNKRVKLFAHLAKLDEISGIGQFGVLVIGTRGGLMTDTPENLTGPEDIVYLRALHQGSVTIQKFEEDQTVPRFGLPTLYEIELVSRTGRSSSTATRSHLLPWRRVIHVAENTLEDEVLGRPRLARVLNDIDSLFKVTGGSAELYWQIIAGIMHADIGENVAVNDGDLEKFEEKYQAALHGLNRLVQTRGIDLNRITGQPTDPSGTYDALKQIVAAGAGFPERILFGSERGQLAGDQDAREWQARVAARNEQHVEPVLIRQTLDRFSELGALPVADYDVEFRPLDAPSTKDRAENAKNFAEAIKAGSPDGATDLIMPAWEFREEILGIDPVPPPIPEGFEFADAFGEPEE